MDARKLALALPFVLIGAPLLLGLVGAVRRRVPASATAAWDWRLTALSAVLYALAFNVTFIVQELFLVIPKAFTPGLKPILFHNNHDWTGHNRLENLFQGTGALATVLMASGLAAWLATRPPRGVAARLFLTWMIFHGFLGALPQVLVGAILPGNDVGKAMDFFGLTEAQKVSAAILALGAIGAVCLWLTPRFLALASAGQPAVTILRVVTIPAVFGVALIMPSRVPGAVDQVVLVPVAVALIGVVWIQGGAWLAEPTPARDAERFGLAIPIALAVVQVLIFQIVLRPGIRFY